MARWLDGSIPLQPRPRRFNPLPSDNPRIAPHRPGQGPQGLSGGYPGAIRGFDGLGKAILKGGMALNKPLRDVNAGAIALNKPLLALNAGAIALNEPLLAVNAGAIALNEPLLAVNAGAIALNKPVLAVDDGGWRTGGKGGLLMGGLGVGG